MAAKADPVEQTAFYTERFWANVAVGRADECWLWIGDSLTWNGYGSFYAVLDGRKYWRAHRVSWFLAHGEPPPRNRMVLHRCDVRLCVNPAHLFLGDAKLNAKDCRKKGRLWFGERNGRAKLTAQDVLDIRASDESAAELAKKYGVHPATIGDARRGKRKWTHLTPPSGGEDGKS